MTAICALQPGDIAVLATTHAEAAAMEAALAACNVPAVRQTREAMFASTEAQDWYLVLKAIAHPRDAGAIRRAGPPSAWAMGRWAGCARSERNQVGIHLQILCTGMNFGKHAALS